MGAISLFFAGLFGIVSWLTPNHSVPWTSFHGEFLIGLAFSVALIGELAQRKVRPDTLSPAVIATLLVSLVPLAQVAGEMVRYAGDGWMVFAYLAAFALAQLLGQRLAWRRGVAEVAEPLAGLFLTASVLSVGLQLYQWQQLLGLSLLVAGMPPLGTPWANFAQPNHLATALFMGLAGALYLYERQRIGLIGTACAALFLMAGMAMTGSRTAWIAVGLLVPALVWARRRGVVRLPVAAALGLGAAFVALLVLWPVANELLLLAPGRSLTDQARAGPRPLIYAAMLDAVSRHPWVGYGWNQGLVAHVAVLEDHPLRGHLVSSSHNLVLDLMVWNGVPLALLITLGMGVWGWRQWRTCRDATQVFLLTAIGGVIVHAMLEYPLSYAYFLLPLGLMVGLLDAASPPRWQLALPRGAALAAAGAMAALLALIAGEYLEVEASTEVLALEVAHIGTHSITSQAPELHLLTQWREYLRFARIEPHPGMSEAELEGMRQVIERFPFSSAMAHYAMANALNGRPEVARQTLVRLCHLHTPLRCRNELKAWAEASRTTYAQLAAVSLPPMPAVPVRPSAAMSAP